jgi:hypothetical protein
MILSFVLSFLLLSIINKSVSGGAADVVGILPYLGHSQVINTIAYILRLARSHMTIGQWMVVLTKGMNAASRHKPGILLWV